MIKKSSITFFLIVLFLGLGCEKEDDFNIRNLNHNIIMILGHGGMGDMYKYPNNSMEAILPVIGIGADGSEIDIQLTKDSVLILYHDEKLDSRTSCSGFAYEHQWLEIQNCLYSTLIGQVQVISVEQLFNSIPNVNELYFSFDCKLSSDLYYDNEYRKSYLRAIKRTCEKYDMHDNVFIEGDMDFLLKAKSLGLSNKGVVIGSTVDDAVENNIFAIGTTLDTPFEEIEYAHKKGVYVMMWGAKTDFGNKKAIELNPDFLQTDKPIPILMLFNRFNYDYRIP